MDEKNGEVFDHHAELFAEIGTVPENEPLRDFVLESCGMIEPGGGGKSIALTLPSESTSSAQETMWTQAYNCTEPTALLNRVHRNIFNQPATASAGDISAPGVENPSSLIDSLVKNMPVSENILDQFSPMTLANKNLNPECRTSVVTGAKHVPNTLFSGLHRISTDKVTQDFLDNLNKFESSEGLVKCDDYENLSWNGVICDPLNNLNFQSQNRLMQSSQSSVDKNGNSALFNNTHGEKSMSISNSTEHFSQNNFLARVSPSASVETNVRTPATSYESASPLSSNRTPIRSDESISPMGSGHTPLRVDESTSPLASIKTPLRTEEGSPVARTPLRTEESCSPAGGGGPSTSRVDSSPSQKPNGASQGLDGCCSPPVALKRSPVPGVFSSPAKAEVEDKNQVSGEADDAAAEAAPGSSKEAVSTGKLSPLSKKEDKDSILRNSPPEISNSDPAFAKALNKQTTKKIPIPFVSATRIDDPVISRKSGKRTLPRKSVSESCVGSSSSSGKSESEFAPSTAIEVSCAKTETEVPEITDKNTCDDAQKVSRPEAATRISEESFTKSKKRRRKSDALCLPTVKRRSRKRVTIYQSSMSPEETGIKLKIKLAPSFQRTKPQKKRRSKKQYGSDEEEEDEEGSGNKRSRKSVRFSSSIKEPEVSEGTGWGTEIPPEVLHKIFQLVVEDQGCVPSLVRFSSVCKLWNSVANRSELWQNIDLSSPYIKQKCKIDRYFRWLLENRLGNIRDLNLNGWKFSNITMVLSLIGTHCTEIESIGLAGWQGLHYEHLKSLLQDCPRLSKFDLSDVSPESKSANSAVSQKSITFLTQTMGERLTQLILAHNTLTCLPQIISSLATHCPNLQVLDLSNIRRVSHTEFALNIEHLQEGCQKLKVLRITNSCITLANVPIEKQVASPGFASLEELSIAGHQGTESLRITSVMDDSCLERILKTSHKLKLLDVRGCTRITDSSLVRVPAWDIQHLFLSGCYVTRQSGSGLELIAQKWSHSLVEIDLAWTTVTEDLNAAVMAFAEKGSESPLRIMNLCGSSVTLEPVKAILSKCRHLESLNLQSCRGLPRGVKRLYENEQLIELRNMLEKKDRDSASEGEDKKEQEADSKPRESPKYSTNNKDDDVVT